LWQSKFAVARVFKVIRNKISDQSRAVSNMYRYIFLLQLAVVAAEAPMALIVVAITNPCNQ
jgi:hypothetical protein